MLKGVAGLTLKSYPLAPPPPCPRPFPFVDSHHSPQILHRFLWKGVRHGHGKHLFFPDSNHIRKILKCCTEVCGLEWGIEMEKAHPKKLKYCIKVCGMMWGMEMENLSPQLE